MKRSLFFAVWVLPMAVAQNEPAPFNQAGRPNRSQHGPWENDITVYRVAPGASPEILATFPRAGVSTATRLSDGQIVVAHQYFPAENDSDFDKVAVHFSTDEGKTWTAAQVFRLAGLPQGMRFPFDPTLVPLEDGSVRLYFTSLKGRRFEEDRPGIYSAISTNCVDFTFELGARFQIEKRPVIDCAVVRHDGVFHLFSPDNGEGINPGGPRREGQERARDGIGYHATSKDGLNFTRQPDVRIEGSRHWLGNAQSDNGKIRFFGTGGPRGFWSATSVDGENWALDENFPPVRGADPGAVKLKDGSWLISATGPPRNQFQNQNQPRPLPPNLIGIFDGNGDGVLDATELENAGAILLQKFDRNKDGKISPEEIRPAGF
jgi:hypothetical protein